MPYWLSHCDHGITLCNVAHHKQQSVFITASTQWGYASNHCIVIVQWPLMTKQIVIALWSGNYNCNVSYHKQHSIVVLLQQVQYGNKFPIINGILVPIHTCTCSMSKNCLVQTKCICRIWISNKDWQHLWNYHIRLL